MAGAVLQQPLGAQVDTTHRDTTLKIPAPVHADSALRDSLAKRDSIHKADSLRIAHDTVRAPIAHAELPNDVEIGHRLHWTRDSLFATGAITVADLLERVPGMTTLRGGWISAPQNAAYLGDIRRVRVFYDGLEMVALDPRAQGVLDLTQITLWSAEDVVVEQAPEEVRVYIRSWRVRYTVPQTRTDVSTGDQATNMYRGFFGQRYRNGAVLQFGAQQYGTTPPSIFGTSSDQVGLTGRVGWAGGNWSIDAYAVRLGRHRGEIFGEVLGDSLPTLASNRTDGYFRVAYADPDSSALWWQVMATASQYKYAGVRTVPTTGLTTAQDSALAITSLDTSKFESQYIATAGTTRGPLHVSATERLFAAGGSTLSSPSMRASMAWPVLSLSGVLEGRGPDSVAHRDLTAQFTPLSFVSLLAGAGQTSDHHVADSSFTASYLRAEAGVRVRNLWLLGGVVRRDSVRLAPPHVFDTTFAVASEGAASGLTAAVRGQLYRLINADIYAVRWNDSLGFYRPRYETRSELSIRTNLLERFPTGHFGLLASVVHEYRSNVRFPLTNGTVETVGGYRTISTLLEIRVLTATVSWQFRNILGERYEQVPFFAAPRQTNFYGVRWEFSG